MASPPALGPRITLLRNARLLGQPDLVDVRITAEGLVGGIQPAPESNSTNGDDVTVDAAGALVLPALLDGHIHPDKTLLGLSPQVVDEVLSGSGLPAVTVQDRIAREIEVRHVADAHLAVEARARNMLFACAAKGTLRVRAHADVDSHVGLQQLRAVQRAADAFHGIVDVQLVAFPQSGVCGPQPGADGVPSLLRAALAEFPDLVIGGLDPISIDGALDPQLDVVLQLAAMAGGADIHLHESGSSGAETIRAICARVEAEPADRLRGKVVISHAFVLGGDSEVDASTQAELDTLLARAGVSIMTTGVLGWPAIARLVAAGVSVMLGNDNCYDIWCGVKGQATGLIELGMQDEEVQEAAPDMLRRAASACSSRRNEPAIAAELLRLATSAVAEATGLGGGDMAAGAEADFVVLENDSYQDKLGAGTALEPLALDSTNRPRRTVYRGGRRLLFGANDTQPKL